MNKKKLKRIFRKIGLYKVLPLWMVLVLILQSSAIVGLVEYYVLRKTAKSPEELVLILKQQVLPQEGYALSVKWNDIGKQMLESGVIDKEKYEQLFSQDESAKESLKYLMNSSNEHMRISERNSHFMVNTLWAMGLINKSPILEEGQMKLYGEGDPMNFASTGGWTLGAKPTRELYSSREIISLTKAQRELVKKVAANIYRPCCDNPTAFPDCNHGMAALGYIELAVKQGAPEEKIYKDVLALNSFWFPQQYVQLAAFLEKRGDEWKNVDGKLALSAQYSSAKGAQQVQKAVQNIPGFQTQGGGCSA